MQVGELVIAAAARHGGDLTPAQLNRLQRVREDKLCIMLGALLRRWVEEDYQGFKVRHPEPHCKPLALAAPSCHVYSNNSKLMSGICMYSICPILHCLLRVPYFLQESMAAEAAELANASFGEVMLHAVGRVYEAQAEIFLGNVITGSLAAIKSKGHTLKSQVSTCCTEVFCHRLLFS